MYQKLPYSSPFKVIVVSGCPNCGDDTPIKKMIRYRNLYGLHSTIKYIPVCGVTSSFVFKQRSSCLFFLVELFDSINDDT